MILALVIVLGVIAALLIVLITIVWQIGAILSKIERCRTCRRRFVHSMYYMGNRMAELQRKRAS